MTDPTVFTKASLTGVKDEHPSLHAGYNDDLAIECDEGSLVGRTDDDRGPARKVTVSEPLTFADNILGIDLSDVYVALSAEQALREAAVSGEASTRGAADDALDVRLDAVEAKPMGQVQAYANAAAFPANPAPPAGTTVLGFDRNTNQLKVWDPDAGSWIAV